MPTTTTATLAHWLLDQEAQAMLRRIDRVKPFALQETMLPAAGLMPAALVGIERHLLQDRGRLRGQVLAFIDWVHGEGRGAEPREVQRRLTFLRLRFNAALTQLDMFSEAITQRSEAETGVWLSGLDVAAQDALALPGGVIEAPPALCYLHRGLGGAIRRARTRLPGGGENPVALIRIPRERMIGFGLASSLVHEVGHQGAALLDLVAGLRVAVQEAQARAEVAAWPAWRLWERWLSEIVADFWALARVGVTSTLGLMAIVSLPRAFVFRINPDDPHPFPWIRVLLSCAIGDALYPHPQWRQLAATWQALYPPADLDVGRRAVLASLGATMPAFVRLVTGFRPASLRGRALADALTLADRAPERLTQLFRSWRAAPRQMWGASPTLIFAVFGRARMTGLLAPEEEDHLLGRLITRWALASTLDLAAASATRVPTPLRLPSSAPIVAPARSSVRTAVRQGGSYG